MSRPTDDAAVDHAASLVQLTIDVEQPYALSVRLAMPSRDTQTLELMTESALTLLEDASLGALANALLRWRWQDANADTDPRNVEVLRRALCANADQLRAWRATAEASRAAAALLGADALENWRRASDYVVNR